jgi:DNA-binding response OmpR family regulator
MARSSLTTLDIDLKGARVLVAEDEWFIADEVAGALDRYHAQVIGPAPDLETARALAANGLDCAVLDINLKGEMVFAFADELAARGVPFVFATGYEAPAIPPRFAEVGHFTKPLNVTELIRAVAGQCLGCSPR